MRLYPALIVLLLSFAALGSFACADEPAKQDEKQQQGEKPKPQEKKPDAARLTVDRIFDSNDFQGESYGGRWLEDKSQLVLFERAKSGVRDLVEIDPESGSKRVLVPGHLLIPSGSSRPLSVEGFALSEDRVWLLLYTNSKRVWRQNTRGDYWLLDRSSHELRQIAPDLPTSSLMFAKLSPTGRHVAYVHERNIYVEDLVDRTTRQLTQTPSEDIINGTFDWVYEEEFGLRDGWRFSPDGKSIAFWQLDTRGLRSYPLVNNTDSLYPQTSLVKYPKTGQRNARCRVGVIPVAGGEPVWIKTPGDLSEHYLARMDWAESSEELLIQHLNRRQNTNQLLLARADSGEVKCLLTERDETWVDVQDELFWLDDGKSFTWISERDGWRHVYRGSRDGGEPQLLTPGEYDVIRLLQVDEDRGSLLFLASPQNATQCYLYRVPLAGGDAQRLSPEDQPGWHHYSISPNGHWAVHTYSSFDRPPVVDLVKLPSHERVRMLEENKKLRERVEKLARTPVEFFRTSVEEGVELDSWCIKPPGFDESKQYPLVIHVYGEPAGQTVLDRWGGSGYLWHLLLAQQGFVVASFDNRGTPAPRGRAWRKCVYQQIGQLGPADQAAAAERLLAQRPYLDRQRMGIWGWSGGGSSTLHALFKHPKLYRAGISIAPVPNQRYYDTIYQERYMGLPSDNVEGFIAGSAVNFAHQLEGELLLVHGTGDDNCHYATTEQLINALVRHNKQFQMMSYPNRTHAIREGAQTTRHLRTMMTQFLVRTLEPEAALPETPTPEPMPAPAAVGESGEAGNE